LRSSMLAIDLLLALVAAVYVDGPLYVAGFERQSFAVSNALYEYGAPDTPLVAIAAGPLLSAGFLQLRDGRIYTTSALMDTLHAGHFDDPQHLASVATEPLRPPVGACSLAGDPPSSGYLQPAFGNFIRQITQHCRTHASPR
jgi:hypothetical protein